MKNVDSFADHAGSMDAINDVISQLKRHEGFVGTVYNDSLGVPTIGYGINLKAGITEREASMILEERVRKLRLKLPMVIRCWQRLSYKRQDVLINMAYQLGVSGLLKFKKMFINLENCWYDLAADEMLNSLWSVQTPERALELSEIMRNG